MTFLVNNYFVSKSSNNTLSSEPVYVPDEILLQVFSHLDIAGRLTCGQVCQQWSRVANDEALWSCFLRKPAGSLKAKQEVLKRFTGEVTSEMQLIKAIESFIEKAPLGQMGAEDFLCEFPFNPECTFTLGLSDGWINQGDRQKMIARNPSPHRCTYVFTQALPNKEKEKQEIEGEWKKAMGTPFHCSSIYRNGLAWLRKGKSPQIGYSALSISFTSFTQKRQFFYTFMITSCLQSSDPTFNTKLENHIDKALEKRAYMLMGRKNQSVALAIAITSIAAVTLGTLALTLESEDDDPS